MPESHTTCQECGTPLDTARTGGVCAPCLLLGAADGASAADAMGSIGGHELIEVIARGGMGIVYRARQSDPEREVALKALPGAELSGAEARQRFKIEAQAMARLDHPHILPVHEIGEEDGTPFYTMKLATGGTLAQRIGGYAGKWREIAELIATLAEAVQFAHSRGVLHRDLKPGNVLFGEDDTMYVSDFGLAKLVGTDTDLTRTLAMMGTPTYLAPELVNGGNNGVSAASDVWSLGVMLYELLAGRPPFQAENVAALLRRIAEAKPPVLESGAVLRTAGRAGEDRPEPCTTSKPPRDLAVITFKALAKDPSRRYHTAQELADDLHRWLAGEPINARPVPLAERVWLWAKRKPALAAMVCLLAFILAGSAWLLVRSNTKLEASNTELRRVDDLRRGQICIALLERAESLRMSTGVGRRQRALDQVRDALPYLPVSTDLKPFARSIAGAALALTDVRVEKRWQIGRVESGRSPMRFTPDLSFYVALVPTTALRDPAWSEGAVGLWRTADNTLLKQMPLTHRESYFNPVMSSDARWLALPVKQRHLEVWDIQAEKLLHVFDSSTGVAAAFAPDGSLIVCLDGVLSRIRLPDLSLERIIGDLDLAWDMDISPDGMTAALFQRRAKEPLPPPEQIYRLDVRSLRDGALVRSAFIHPYGEMAWMPDSNALFMFNRATGLLEKHDLQKPASPPEALLRTAGTGRRIAVWPDGRMLAWADNGGFIRFHDLWLDEPLTRVPGTAMNLKLDLDGTRFVFNPSGDTAAIGEMLSPLILTQRRAAVERTVDAELAPSHDGRWIATASKAGITLWRAADLTPVVHREASQVENLHFSADNKQLRFHSVGTRRTVWTLHEAADGPVSLGEPGEDTPRSMHNLNAASPNGRWEVSTRLDEKTAFHYLWRDGEITGQYRRQLNPHPVEWHSRLLSPDGRWGVWGCMAVESSPLSGFTYVTRFEGDHQRIMISKVACHTQVAISPDSRWLVGGEGASYVIWDANTWQKAHTVAAKLSDSVPGSAAFSQDGSLLALEVDHGHIRFVQTGTWKPILTLAPPQDIPIERMAFSPDGRHLYTTGGQILHRWDITRLKEELGKMGIGW